MPLSIFESDPDLGVWREIQNSKIRILNLASNLADFWYTGVFQHGEHDAAIRFLYNHMNDHSGMQKFENLLLKQNWLKIGTRGFFHAGNMMLLSVFYTIK